MLFQPLLLTTNLTTLLHDTSGQSPRIEGGTQRKCRVLRCIVSPFLAANLVSPVRGRTRLMVDHVHIRRGLATSAEPCWVLGVIVDLMFHKSFNNKDLPPPPNSSRSLSTKFSASQHRPTDRARPFGVARGLLHGLKALAVPCGLGLATPLLVPHLLHDTSLQPAKDRGPLAHLSMWSARGMAVLVACGQQEPAAL